MTNIKHTDTTLDDSYCQLLSDALTTEKKRLVDARQRNAQYVAARLPYLARTADRRLAFFPVQMVSAIAAAAILVTVAVIQLLPQDSDVTLTASDKAPVSPAETARDGAVPLSLYETNDKTFASLAEAVSAAPKGGTVKVMAGFEIAGNSHGLRITKPLRLEAALANHT